MRSLSSRTSSRSWQPSGRERRASKSDVAPARPMPLPERSRRLSDGMRPIARAAATAPASPSALLASSSEARRVRVEVTSRQRSSWVTKGPKASPWPLIWAPSTCSADGSRSTIVSSVSRENLVASSGRCGKGAPPGLAATLLEGRLEGRLDDLLEGRLAVRCGDAPPPSALPRCSWRRMRCDASNWPSFRLASVGGASAYVGAAPKSGGCSMA